MATKKTKKTTSARSTAKKQSSSRKTSSKKSSIDSGMKKEITLLLVGLVSVILFLGAFDIAGSLGTALHTFLCGLFGIMGYVFPFLFAFIATYLILRKPIDGNHAVLKVVWVFLLFICLCCIMSLLDNISEASKSYDAEFFFDRGVKGVNGGMVGGCIISLIYPAIGVFASYAIFVVLLIILFILATGTSVLRPIKKGGERVKERAKEDMEYHAENRELRIEERKLRREEKLAARRDALEKTRSRVPDSTVEDVDLRHGKSAVPASQSSEGIEVAEGEFDIAASEEEARRKAREFANGGYRIHRGDEVTTVDSGSTTNGARLDTVSGEETATNGLQNAEGAEPETKGRKVANLINGWKGALSRDNYEEEPSDISASEEVPEDIFGEIEGANATASSTASEQSSYQGMPSEATDEEAEVRLPHAGEVVWGVEPNPNIEDASSGRVFSTNKPVRTPKKKIKKNYKLPPMSLLTRGEKGATASNAELKATATKLENTLRTFGVGATITDISCGPTVTRYELKPDDGVKINKIVALTNDIKLALAASDIRIEAPIPGKSAVGIEVPNSENTTVMLRDVLDNEKFKNAKSKLTFGIGKDIGGDTIFADLAKMPHVLIAGATGSGKSVCLNTIIMSILYRATPDEVKFIMIDPKQVELTIYQSIPHMLVPVVTDAKKALGALNWCVAEMETRYTRFSEMCVRDLASYNNKIEEAQAEWDAQLEHDEDDERPEKIPQLVVVVDEMADLMMVAAKDVEDAICRLAQLARAAGIHIVLATQRPSVKVVTGLIKANIPSRIALSVTSSIDSRIIIDMTGAETLLGKGDMLYAPQWLPKPIRVQGAFVTDEEREALVDFWHNQKDESASAKEKSIVNEIASRSVSGGAVSNASDDDDMDELFEACGRFAIESEKGSIGNFQRKFRIGFNRAARIMDQLCDAGVVGPDEGKKPREILMTIEEFEEFLASR